MKKFLVAFDGLKFDQISQEYSIALAKITRAFLEAVFLDDQSYKSYKIYDLIVQGEFSADKLKILSRADVDKRQMSTEKFKDAVKLAKVQFGIRHDKKIAINELIHETIYADMLFISIAESFSPYDDLPPSRFLKDLLSNAQCPVFLTPKHYHPIEKIVFLYDGHASSIYAIKMFGYLFPQFSDLPIELVCVKSNDDNLHLPDHHLVKELLNKYYPSYGFSVLKGIPEEEIIKRLQSEEKHCLLVLGAYRRTVISRWFRSSLADAIIKHIDMPLFIAHNK
jgi:hypothetical protein